MHMQNHMEQTVSQYLRYKWSSGKTISKVELKFGNHYAKDYKFLVKINGKWKITKTIKNNTSKNKVRVWFKPLKNVTEIRIYCAKYAKDDYFSVYEMKCMR